MDGGAWWAAVHGVRKSQTRLSDFAFALDHLWNLIQCKLYVNSRKYKVNTSCCCTVKASFDFWNSLEFSFLRNIFDPWLFESTNTEPRDTIFIWDPRMRPKIIAFPNHELTTIFSQKRKSPSLPSRIMCLSPLEVAIGPAPYSENWSLKGNNWTFILPSL